MHVLITGTSSGIGYGLAQEFVPRKTEVWGISRRAAADLSQAKNYHHLQLDLTDYDKVRQLVPEFIGKLEQLDLVILNAGVLGKINMMHDLGVEEMKQVMEINVWANKVLLDILFKQVKNIRQVIGMSTKASLHSTPGWGAYSVSKAGLNMLMNVYANEYPETHFNAFAPGLIDSEIQETIYNIKETDKYPSVKKLQDARFTDEMPGSREAAPQLVAGIKKALKYESGTFVDVREM